LTHHDTEKAAEAKKEAQMLDRAARVRSAAAERAPVRQPDAPASS
jgi:hypothetical protein